MISLVGRPVAAAADDVGVAEIAERPNEVSARRWPLSR
jgi:hypothetical protein